MVVHRKFMKSKNHSVKILKNMTLDITLGTWAYLNQLAPQLKLQKQYNYIISPGKTLDLDVAQE